MDRSLEVLRNPDKGSCLWLPVRNHLKFRATSGNDQKDTYTPEV